MTASTKDGIKYAVELLEKGYLNRYQNEDYDYLLKAETALAEYIGVRYALGLNSGASALFLCLKAINIKPGEKVLTNAFTFNAVPSSIVHAGGVPVLVECDQDFCLDLDHLTSILEESKDDSDAPRVLMLSFMRGRVPDMDAVMRIVEKYQLTLIEDIAHAYAVKWKGKMLGTFGKCAGISTQANKLMNSGEGGVLLTNDPAIQAQAIVMSGCYEKYYLKHHKMMPPADVIEPFIKILPNYSIRMTNLQGAILYPQVAQLDARRTRLNQQYMVFCALLKTECSSRGIEIRIPGHLEHTLPVYDSIQFVVKGLSKDALYKALQEMKTQHGLKVGVFGHPDNARNPFCWKFLADCPDAEQSEGTLKKTKAYLEFALDMRLHLETTPEKMRQVTQGIARCLQVKEQ